MGNSLNIVIPAFNEALALPPMLEAVSKVFAGEDYTLILVDDGSRDATWEAIEKFSSNNKNARGLRLSRNFGKEAAMAAGLKHADGDCVIMMDCDMQHPPETAFEMYRLWQKEKYPIIEGKKIKRQKESLLYKVCASFFYSLLKKLSGLDLENMSDFKLLDRNVVKQLNEIPERNTFFRAMTGWTGLKTGYVYYEPAARQHGETHFRIRGLVKLAVDSISSYSSAPLHLVTLLGFGFTLFAIVLGLHTLNMHLSGQSVEGFTTVILLLLIIGGILMISLGMIGIYIAKIYHEVKQRPRYIISERTNTEK
jgi:dolichol-phosphate mannosyltransferase